MDGQRTVLRRLRREREITIAHVAIKTGINAGTLSLIERLLVTPTDKQKSKLEKFFKRPADELLSVANVAA